jgi:hypothetical protein
MYPDRQTPPKIRNQGRFRRMGVVNHVSGLKRKGCPGTLTLTPRYAGFLRHGRSFARLRSRNYVHMVINHSQEYVRGQVHTQGNENFWALLKRTLKGTYVAVEPFHLDQYLSEQFFRYTNCAAKDNPLTDADRFALAVSQIQARD